MTTQTPETRAPGSTGGPGYKSDRRQNTLFLMIIGGGVILFLSLGMRQSFGLFQLPMLESKGWGREIFSIAIALQNIVWGITQPVFGYLADRFGAAKVACSGGVLYALGLVLMAFPESPLLLYLGGGVIVGMALAAGSFAVVLGALGRAAPPGRQGAVMGIATALGSMGQFLMIPGSSALIGAVGWSDAFLILAGAMLVICLCATTVRALPVTVDANAPAPVDHDNAKAAIAEAMGHSGFWLLMAGFFVCGFQITFIATHVVAHVEDTGLSKTVAAGTLMLIGLGNVAGSYVASALGDRYRRKYLLSILYALRAVAILALVAVPASPAVALTFGLVMGLLWLGTVPLTTSLVGQIFGTRYMTTLFGFVYFTHQIGAALGVYLGGRIFDDTGSYDLVWLIAAGLGVLAALLHWPIADKPLRTVSQPAGTA